MHVAGLRPPSLLDPLITSLMAALAAFLLAEGFSVELVNLLVTLLTFLFTRRRRSILAA